MSKPPFRRSLRTISGMALIALLAGACATNANPTASAPAASGNVDSSSAPLVQPNNPPVVGVFVTSLGSVLGVGSGKTLYVRAGDSATASTCLDDCATAWPPLFIAAGTTIVGPPGASGPFGRITRPDGSVQATYNGMPLYFWQNDVNSGDTTGQGINGFTVAQP